MARVIESFAELRSLAGAGPVYVRWEVDGAKGIERGYSINHVTGAREDGISVNALPTSDDDDLATAVLEYRGVCGNHGWIVAGTEVGRGSDNEPILANVRIVAEVGAGLIAEAERIVKARWEREDASRRARPAYTPPASYGNVPRVVRGKATTAEPGCE